MGASINFDATTVDPTSPFTPLPNGEYTMAITASEVKPTKDQRGKYLQLELQVLDEGAFKGRKVWDRLNIVNPNATAQDIAQRQLSAICHATGVLKLTNSAQLHGIPMRVRVVVRQDAGQEPQNDVKGYKAVDGAHAHVAAAAPAAPAPIAPPSENAPAWARKAS